MSEQNKTYVVVGAGLCGLAIAERLAGAGHNVHLVEKRGKVGGLARSFDDAGCKFDLGPHYFFLSVREDASAYVKSIVKGPYEVLSYRASAQLRGREVAWPPNAASIFKLPPSAVLQYFMRVVKSQYPTDVDFQSFTTAIYGQTMFESFFGPYIGKKLPIIRPHELHRDWWILARRTIGNDIDLRRDSYFSQIGKQAARKRKGVPLAKGLLKALQVIYKTIGDMTSKDLPKVLYPHGGIGMIGEGIKEAFEGHGGQLHLDSGRTVLSRDDKGHISRVEWGSHAVDRPDRVIWTGSIHELADQLGFPRAEVDYMTVALVYVTARGRMKQGPYYYTYFADPSLLFNRLYFPSRAIASLVPEGMDCVCAEVGIPMEVTEPDREELGRKVVEGLVRIGKVRREDITEVKVRLARESYPVYPLDYLERLNVLWKRLGEVPNLLSVGRTGQYYYNNMALTISMAMDVSRMLLEQPSYWEEKEARLAAAQAGG